MFNKKLVAIDIGSKNIKIVEGKSEGEKVIVTRTVMLKTPEQFYNDGNITNPIIMKKYLENEFKEKGIKGKNVIFTTQSSSIITRIIEVPWAKDDELESILKYEVQQYLPIELDEYIVKHKVIEEFNKDEIKMVRARVAVYPKNMAKSYWEISKGLKLVPKVLDLNSNAITKLFTNKELIQINEHIVENTIGILDIGYDQMELNIISDGILEFTRNLMGGGNYLDANIASQLQISEEEAEDKKIKLCNLKNDFLEKDYEIGQVNTSVKIVIDRWNGEILRMLEYFRNKNRDKLINKLYIHGGTSNIKGICEYIQSFIGIEVEKIQSLDNIELKEEAITTDITGYLNAIGSFIRIK